MTQIFYFKCRFFCRVHLFLTGRGAKGLKTGVTILSAPPVSVSFVSEGGKRRRRTRVVSRGVFDGGSERLAANGRDAFDVISFLLAAAALKYPIGEQLARTQTL